MRTRIAVGLTLAGLLLPALPALSSDRAVLRSDAGVTATVKGSTAVLSDGLVTRRWSVADGAVRTTALLGGGGSWAAPGPDFSMTVDGVPTTSVQGWTLQSVHPVRPQEQPGRPESGRGAGLLFEYSLAGAGDLTLDRLVLLRPHSSVFETRSTLRAGLTPARVSAYSLDQVVARSVTLPAEVHAYHGGSDWRDDYRQVSHPKGSFDVEAEVAQFGSDSGFFLVAQRRGGVMSRAGRDADGRSWVGVDWPRDAFDWGPLRTDPPGYNRQDNPAYPVPIRSRLALPGTSLDLGTAFLGVFSGGHAAAAANFTNAFSGAAAPAYAHSVGINTFHPWGHGDGLSDRNLRTQVDLAKSLGIETFMLDDQWQGGDGGESGDWQWDSQRFPDTDKDGTPDFVDYLHQQGLKLGLWMSPVEFNGASQTYAAHPDWACAPIGDATARVQDDAGLGVWDVTNPAFQDYLVGVVRRLERTDDVREFKFDFMAWVDCASSAGVHDYADYEAAFVDTVRRMQALDPTVTFELDETNDQRCWPFESASLGPSWFDNGHLHGSGRVEKLLHDVWSAAPWVPPSSLGLGVYDDTLTGPYAGVRGVDALLPLALLTHVTFWTDLSKLTAAQRHETRWWLRWYERHRSRFGDAVYELTPRDPIDGKTWAAWQTWNGRRGYVFAFRQGASNARSSLALQGLRPTTAYQLTDVRSGQPLGTWTGAELAAGHLFRLHQFASKVIDVRPTDPES